MQHYKYLVLGAGPAGLTFANWMINHGEESIKVVEKENEAGGLCRSAVVDGSPLDIGGGHFLDVRRPMVNEFLFSFMPVEEWDIYDRDSQIHICGEYVHHPLEANIWEFSEAKQKEYLDSISEAGCLSGEEKPEKFVDWIYWKLGRRIAEDYMIPYNSKMFSSDLNCLGTYWLDKLPNVSYRNTLKSCREHKPYGEQPGHARFYYPKKFGYGELWRRMGEALGNHLELNAIVKFIDFDRKTVATTENEYSADYIITTVPWCSFEEVLGMPDDMKNSIKSLKHSSVAIEYYKDNLDTSAQWIYEPSMNFDYHRILVRHNFCPNSNGYWTETNIEQLHHELSDNAYVMEYAYPLNTINKPEIMNRLTEWSKGKGVFPLGRWGEHMHYNSDVVVELAIRLARDLMEEKQ